MSRSCRKRLLSSLLIGLLTLTACGDNPQPPQPAQPTAASTAVALSDATQPAPAQPTLAPTEVPTLEPSATPAPPTETPIPTDTPDWQATRQAEATALTDYFRKQPMPLQISEMRKKDYPGSDLVIEQTLDPGVNYTRYIASYQSDGLKIYGLFTVPNGPKPPTGWPIIIFNHGFIPPAQYRTTERYVAYQDAFARAGYITFKSDYRGHGNSEGRPSSGYGSPDYASDVLNALASVKRYKNADPNRIGMWGHSMGGQVTLRAMVVSKEIKAGVIWGGVVAPYTDIMTRWRRGPNAEPVPSSARGFRSNLLRYGTPQENPDFWASISPNSFLADISGPLQLDHSTTDEEVPYEFSQTLDKELQAAGKTVEFYSYPGDNHNIAANLYLALQRSVAFFDKYVKGS